MMTRAFVVAATLSIAAPALAQSEYREGPIAPGEHLALRISADGAVSVESDPAVDLPAAAAAAVEEAPPWLRPDLADALRRADPSDREALAALVLEAGDPLLVDEIAFVASHLAPEDMDGADLEMIAENAAVIYEVAPELAYVDIVEVEDGGDWYTTLSYHVVETGGEGEWTLDRDDYYRWVVMPMLDDGAFRYVDPSSGSYADPPGGRSYRDYIWHDADDYRSYGLQVALRRPNTIDDEWLDGAGFGETAPAHGILSGFEVDPIVLVRDEATGRAAAVAFVWGDGRCCSNAWPGADGWVYATTIPVEAAAAAGDADLLENLLAAGGGNLGLPYDILTTPLAGAGVPAGVLVVRDRMPFDLESDPNEETLVQLMYDVEVVDSATLATMDLTVDEVVDPDPEIDGDEYERHYPRDFAKIVIPSDQPLALYQTLAAHSEELERYVDWGGVLEMHLATRPEDDWTGLRMPAGIACDGQDPDDWIGDLETYGYPRLADVVADAPYLWDSVKVTPGGEGSGRLPLDPSMTAVERIGWWASQSLDTRISEQITWARGNVERSKEPVRILWNHFGNCGELQDVITAGGRTALLPIMPVSTLADDHVWNEFLFSDGWHPLQTSWSDAGWHVDDYSVGMDGDVGGGKTIAGLVGWRGDGRVENLLGRYEPEIVDDEGHIDGEYSRHVTLEVSVEDRDGRPVDGARVLLATPGYYDPSELWIATWGFTGADGVAEIPVGEENDYYVQVESSLGTFPAPSAVAEWLTTEETAEPDQVFQTTVTYGDAGLDVPAAGDASPPDPGKPYVPISVAVSARRQVMHLENPLNYRTFAETSSPGEVDLYVVDDEGYARFVEGEPFEPAAAAEGVSEGDLELRVPSGGEWLVVVSNRRRSSAIQEVGVKVTVGDEVLAEDEEADESCGCAAAGSRLRGAGAGGLLGLLLR